MLDIMAELAEYDARESGFEKLAKDMKKITKKNVYKDFSFPKCGGVFGIVRHVLQNPKKEQELLLKIGLRKSEIEFFRDNAGNTSYLSSDGEIVKTRQMNVEKTQALIKHIAQKLNIALSDEDILFEITEERWEEIRKLAEKKAKASKKASKLVNTTMVFEE